MIDPSRYEKLRAVHDRATRQNPELGVAITPVDLSADRDTVLPVESALGYSISQHIFLGGGPHLAVEGSSDFVFLQRMAEILVKEGLIGLDARFAIIPVGGDGNMPAIVALLGRRLKVSALIDGARSQTKSQRVTSAATSNGVPETAIVVCGDVGLGAPNNADIEDMFDVDDYLRLFNLAFQANLKKSDLPKTEEPILKKVMSVGGAFDHAEPAHALTRHMEEFSTQIEKSTKERFAALFERLNATLAE